MNMRSIWRTALVLALSTGSLIAALHAVPSASAQEELVRIIFMHHSTGEALIAQGGLREAFGTLGYELWDHGYNGDGLVDPSGEYLGVNWDVPGDNTDPDGWQAVFSQPVTDPPTNTLSHMLSYDVIVFKSCFPASDIQSEEQFEDYRRYFLDIRAVMDQHPDKLFIPFTPPPLVPNATSPDAAARARRWAEYLTSDDYLDGHPNVAVFDFFSLLSDEQGYLRAEYRPDEWDSHPNELANQTVGPIFADFVDRAIRAFVPGQPTAVMAHPPAVETPVQPTPAPMSATVPGGERLFDFAEAGALEGWWSYTNEPVDSFACDRDPAGYDSEGALRLSYAIDAEGSAGCGADLIADTAWAEAAGVSFYWRSEPPGLHLRVALAVADPTQENPDVGEATPFEIDLGPAPGEWSPAIIRWTDLAKAQWVGETGVNVFDPTQVVWVAFDVGYWAEPQVGALWIDGMQLFAAE